MILWLSSGDRDEQALAKPVKIYGASAGQLGSPRYGRSVLAD